MKKALISAVIIALIAGMWCLIKLRKRNIMLQALEARRHTEEVLLKENFQKFRNEQALKIAAAEKDRSVSTSILRGFKISLEIQPQWKQEKDFLIQVNLEKELDKTYLVDSISQSCLLFVNNRLWSVLRQDQEMPTARELLPAELGSSHPVFHIAPNIPDHAELMVEWVNYNSKTGEIETLKSQSVVWNRQL